MGFWTCSTNHDSKCNCPNEGGANYSVYKTVSNGQGDAGSQKALTLGLNPIAVSAVDFDRTVKIRLTDDVAINSLAVNGIYQFGSALLHQ